MLAVLLAGVIAGAAALAIVARRHLGAAVALAAASAATAALLYLIGAQETAVIELSVGAGLVSLLFVFVLSLVGQQALPARPIVARPAAAFIALSATLLLARAILPPAAPAAAETQTFGEALWGRRVLDLALQILLVFSGTIGVLSLLADSGARRSPTLAGLALRATAGPGAQPRPGQPAPPQPQLPLPRAAPAPQELQPMQEEAPV